MASIFKRLKHGEKSPFWWIKWKDPSTGKVVREATTIRIDDPLGERRARKIAAQKRVAELDAPRASLKSDRWEAWVGDYLNIAYRQSPLTLERYLNFWAPMEVYLREKKVATPGQLRREHCMRYVEWRTQTRAGSHKKAGHNTAVAELKILGMICKEAVRRELIVANPCTDLGIRKKPHREKPELTNEHLAFIAEAIEKEPPAYRVFLRNSFAIARFQGCRLSETYFDPQTEVRLPEETPDGVARIRFLIKRGRIHETILAPDLIPLFRELRASGATETYPKPPTRQRMSLIWSLFLERCGMREKLPGVCFHSLRVTAATRLARANVSEAKAMRFIGHASATVHRAYQRLQLTDLNDAAAALR